MKKKNLLDQISFFKLTLKQVCVIKIFHAFCGSKLHLFLFLKHFKIKP